MQTFKRILGGLFIATLVAVACQFLPLVNALFSDYLFGFFFAAVVLPIGIKCYEAHMVKVRAVPEVERRQRQEECDEWHEESSDAMTSGMHCFDLRNIDQQLHHFNGYKD